MKLYDIFYHGSSSDKNVALPAPKGDIKQAVNTNWSGETLVPVRGPDGLYWMRVKHQKPYAECPC